ncbi:MAG TPA: hypothetical protein DCW29_24385 [Janthinobacterium sp.]|nr:hypothetical protein [Janthinobacterium sp.]
MHDDTHLNAGDSDYCASCGQLIRPAPTYGSRQTNSNRIGIGISILVHLLGVLYFLTRSAEPAKRAPPPAHESAMVYIAPLADKPKPKQPSKKPELAKVKPPPRRKQAVASITPPKRPKQEVVVPPLVSLVPAPKAVPEAPKDMAEMVAEKQRKRAEAHPQPAPEESEAERGQRIARANIAGAQGKNSGSDREDSGGVFQIVDQSSQHAEIKFRGWNSNFKRRWLTQVAVERGAEQDIETAIVKRMIELIRKEKPGDFVWESHRLGKNVPMSARVEDTAELQAFLLKEFFPDYRRR